MTRRFSILSVAALIAIFAFSGCASKDTAPADVGAAETDVTDVDEGMTEDLSLDEGMGAELSLPTVYFDFDRSVIRFGDRELLKAAADQLNQDESVRVTIEGHCDERGSIEYNLALGERRAQSVKSYLTSLGVSPSRLETISYGEERPVNLGSGEAAWAENRRAELVVNR